MNRKNTNFNNGFTLVELSIVLVVIGLIVSGIVATQSMILVAKVTGQMQQISEFDNTISAFKDKYHSLPGDTTRLSNPGNGNRRIESGAAGGESYGMFSQEVKRFWNHMQLAGFEYKGWDFSSPSSCVGSQCDLTGPVADMPVSVFSKKVGILVAYDNRLVNRSKNGYNFSNYNTGDIDDSTSDLTCKQIKAFDKKFDDGLPGSGKIISPENNCSDTSTTASMWVDLGVE